MIDQETGSISVKNSLVSIVAPGFFIIVEYNLSKPKSMAVDEESEKKVILNSGIEKSI